MPSAKPHIILIDGKSGVGKSTLAEHMAHALDATVLHLDDVYPGWEGLEHGRDAVIRDVLVPLSHSRAGRVETWDWENDCAGPFLLITPHPIVIVEGCGISTQQSRGLAETVIWVDCDETERRARLAGREGGRFEVELAEWDRHVDRHITENDPLRTATLVVRT